MEIFFALSVGFLFQLSFHLIQNATAGAPIHSAKPKSIFPPRVLQPRTFSSPVQLSQGRQQRLPLFSASPPAHTGEFDFVPFLIMPGEKMDLRQKLQSGERILVAEGYVVELERRGFLKAGPFVPEAVLDRPDLVKALHEEFLHAGSDVVEAFTYYGHREGLRTVGREGQTEELNKRALKLARAVARESGKLLAGNICNSNVYNPNDPASIQTVKEMLTESVGWAAAEGVDFIVAETFTHVGEARIAAEVIKEVAPNLPFVITFTPTNAEGVTQDGLWLKDACRVMEAMGAAATGLNCSTGPETMIAFMREIRAACRGPLACLPCPFRTTADKPLIQQLSLPDGKAAFPSDLEYFSCSLAQIHAFGKACEELNIQYVGLCCGNSSRAFRALAESFGREPPASHFSADEDFNLLPPSRHPYRPGNVPFGM